MPFREISIDRWISTVVLANEGVRDKSTYIGSQNKAAGAKSLAIDAPCRRWILTRCSPTLRIRNTSFSCYCPPTYRNNHATYVEAEVRCPTLLVKINLLDSSRWT